MQNGSKRTKRVLRYGTVPSPNRWTSNAARPGSRDLKTRKEPMNRIYMALARAEAQIGNMVGAENYYKHAEHYFRLMS